MHEVHSAKKKKKEAVPGYCQLAPMTVDSGYVDTPTESSRLVNLLTCIVQSFDSPRWLSTAKIREVGLMQSVDRPSWLSTDTCSERFSSWILSSFLIRLQSFFIFFLHGITAYILEGVLPLFVLLERIRKIEFVFESSRVSLHVGFLRPSA